MGAALETADFVLAFSLPFAFGERGGGLGDLDVSLGNLEEGLGGVGLVDADCIFPVACFQLWNARVEDTTSG